MSLIDIEVELADIIDQIDTDDLEKEIAKRDDSTLLTAGTLDEERIIDGVKKIFKQGKKVTQLLAVIEAME